MNSKTLTLLTFATVTFLSFTSIAKAETAPVSTINSPASTAIVQDKTQQTAEKSPESTAVVEDKGQQTTETNSQAETVDRNSTQTPETVTTKDLPSSSGNYGHKCGR